MSPQKFCITYFALVVKANFFAAGFFFRGGFFGARGMANFFGADSEGGGNASAT